MNNGGNLLMRRFTYLILVCSLTLFHSTLQGQKVTWSQPFPEDKKMQYMKNKGVYESEPLLLDEFSYEKISDDNRPDLIVSHDQSKTVCAFRKIPADKKEGQIYEAIVVDTSLHVLYKKEIAVPMNEKHF